MLRDVTKMKDVPFGGKVVVFGGDFRRVLPVVPHGGRADQVNACMTHSPLWRYVKRRQLHTNLRLRCDAMERTGFADWLLRIGDGVEPTRRECIALPRGLHYVASVDELIESVYPALGTREFDRESIEDIAKYFVDRSILSAYNDVVDEINERAFHLFAPHEREEMVYLQCGRASV